jgi:hypothetical protein
MAKGTLEHARVAAWSHGLDARLLVSSSHAGPTGMFCQLAVSHAVVGLRVVAAAAGSDRERGHQKNRSHAGIVTTDFSDVCVSVHAAPVTQTNTAEGLD